MNKAYLLLFMHPLNLLHANSAFIYLEHKADGGKVIRSMIFGIVAR